jgi:hypothetical protein
MRDRAVYDQEADRTVQKARRVPIPDPVGPRHVATPDPGRPRRAVYDLVARWLAVCSLAVVTLIAALIILH